MFIQNINKFYFYLQNSAVPSFSELIDLVIVNLCKYTNDDKNLIPKSERKILKKKEIYQKLLKKGMEIKNQQIKTMNESSDLIKQLLEELKKNDK